MRSSIIYIVSSNIIIFLSIFCLFYKILLLRLILSFLLLIIIYSQHNTCKRARSRDRQSINIMTIKHDLGRGNTFVMGLLIGSTAAILIHRIATSRRSTLPNEKCDSASLNDDQNNQIQKCLPPEIRSEMLSRNALYFASSNGMPRIESSHVLVVGLGGVGSHTAHMLARSGVGYIRMVDFDQVTLSSLNRHAVATLKDVGLPKAIVLARHLREICPDEEKLVLDPVVKMYTGDNERDGSMMDPPSERCQRWDLVIDAIDDVPTKANLIAYCAKRGIRVISCMGAGGKADPTRVHISDLRSASKDPLATSVRQKLRYLWRKEQKETGERNGKIFGEESDSWLSCIDDDSKVAVVYSSEKVVAKLAQITDEQMEEGLHNFGAMDNMRVRVLPVVGTMPAIMGQTLAAMALCELGGKPFQVRYFHGMFAIVLVFLSYEIPINPI